MRTVRRDPGWVVRAAAGGTLAALLLLLLFSGRSTAAAPVVVEISEPAVGAASLGPADVHMVARFATDAEHVCSDWQIRATQPDELVWEAPCAKGQEKVHIHLGDGRFVNSYAGRDALQHDTAYVLRVRSRDDVEAVASLWATRGFHTRSPGPLGSEATAWTTRPGYVVETFAEDLWLPVNIAMVPDPGPHAGDPLMYVTELYGNVKVIARDGTVGDYATGLLNFNPTGNFPGSGEIGLTGAAVEPDSGDLFVSLVYQDHASAEPKPHYAKVIRLHGDERGLRATGQTTVLDMPGEGQGASHQISNLTISPAGELFVHNGDGGNPATARNLGSFRGKVLGMSLDGAPLPSNPFYDAGDGIGARDYVYAYGFRNPFGGAWRLSDETHWSVENGPSTDRLALVRRGADYLWSGSNSTMTHLASYNWDPSHAPVNIDFVEPEKHGGSGFPPAAMGHAFVTESGPTWASGPQEHGKRIVEFALGTDGGLLSGPETLAEYTGVGKATAVGLATGPGGLYFTDLYKDTGFSSPIDRGAKVLRVRYCGAACPVEAPPASGPPLDRTPPRIKAFRVVRKAFRVGSRHRARRGRHSAARRGTSFRYWLSERARTRIRIRRIGRRGQFLRPRGTIAASGRAGPNRRTYSGRLNGRPPPPGRYRATIRAVDRSGNRSRRHVARFRVVRIP